VPSPVSEDNFTRMVEYYGMTPAIYPVSVCLYDDDNGDVLRENVVCQGCDLEVKAAEWATYSVSHMDPHPDDTYPRTIVSFEVTLGSVERIQVGWMHGRSKAYPQFGNQSGVGDAAPSVGLDISRSGILVDGTLTAVPGLSVKEGTAIRSEDFGRRWYVDGRLVAKYNGVGGGSGRSQPLGTQESEEPGVIHFPGGNHSHSNSYYFLDDTIDDMKRLPTISCKGTFTVSGVVYKP